ncbi:MAG: undecaprenyldiphospho-muramoylpentapeptide beta-N-acetylglucosaminyltransferase [Firmicutes bacterium]|nr:undecaprenyldiphospho-muramoylpentapeptide beta-N-acetylglucosaminyltransferase [Bacillota bacterium]
MKVLITGGGTGGHIYPALAIAKKIKEEHPDSSIVYVGTKNSMESEIVPKEGFNFKSIRVKGFRRKLSMDTLKSIKELALGLNDARKLIKEFSPDIVIGTGGYVCGPLVLISSLKGIPTLIHEQNALPGITNRILSKFTDKIAASFEESKKYFKDSSKVTITGNPIRKEIVNIKEINKSSAYRSLGITSQKKTVLSFGGSGGQKSLNDAMEEVIAKNINNDDIQIIHVTGKRLYDNFVEGIESKGINLSTHKNIKVLPYLFEMPKAQSIANLIITGGGALSIAEINAIGKASIIIPKAYATDNHQEFNAKALEDEGAGVMVLEKELSGEKLNNLIIDLLKNERKLRRMEQNSKRIGITDSADRIIAIINQMVK